MHYEMRNYKTVLQKVLKMQIKNSKFEKCVSKSCKKYTFEILLKSRFEMRNSKKSVSKSVQMDLRHFEMRNSKNKCFKNG